MMDKNQENIAVSALYTAGVWQWARFGGADIATPKDAGTVFKVVNAFHRFYRWINPLTYSLRHQLLHRHAAIDRLIADSGCTQVLEVASGFSARGLRFSAEPKLRYVEIDLPDMVAAKRRQLARSAAGSAALARPNLEIRAGDVFEIDYAAESARAPTAVVTEGLMMYLRRDQQMPLWKKIADALRVRGGVYLFDYIPLSEEPPRSLLGRLLHFFLPGCCACAATLPTTSVTATRSPAICARQASSGSRSSIPARSRGAGILRTPRCRRGR